MSEYLFVGGPADGRMIETGGLPFFKVAVPSERDYSYVQPGYPIDLYVVGSCMYEAKRLVEGDFSTLIYQAKGNTAPLIEVLIRRYAFHSEMRPM